MIQSAPAKLILCGEHAVVYARPAIALPLASLRARAEITPGEAGSGITIAAPDLSRVWHTEDTPDDPLSVLALDTLAHLGVAPAGIMLTIRSDIPIASGMGSGAAVATALVRALAAYAGRELPPAQISSLVYESERRFHGTPSGIDNTVVAYERPIWFLRSSPPPFPLWESGGEGVPSPIAPIAIAMPFTLVIGDTGLRSPTREPVGEVRRRWQEAPAHYEALFDQIGDLVGQVRAVLALGDIAALGPLLNANHELLVVAGVSSPELDWLVRAARAAGALGAKLSGGGWGGVMLALTSSDDAASVAAALTEAGAARVFTTTIAATVASDLSL